VPPTNSDASVIGEQIARVGLPIRLEIPSINVDAKIYDVGLTSSGAMDVKQDITQVAWYEFGPRPGEIGSAVIAGHYGWLDSGEASVFNNLHNLNKNDEITVIDDKGLSIVFVVQNIKKFDPDADATSIFTSSDNKAHLNLITCDGTWENSQQTYSDRLVVFADKK
jgi:LPXTG-site transpeptidase (sortase) family protein